MIRILDILFSLIALIVLVPILMPIALLLKLTGEGEIFYSQKRIGKDGKTFKLLKFATMLKNSPNMQGGTITTKNDPRILPIGYFLRKTKINELPQLLNVILGDMSLIGPRPMVESNFNYYNEEEKSIISSVQPGLSGLGSILFRNEEKLLDEKYDRHKFYQEQIVPYKASLEIWFVKHNSISLYLFLIFATIYVVLFSDSKIIFKYFPSIPSIPFELNKY